MKVDRLPGWAFRRLTVEQRDAFDVLRWQAPRPAERARLKQVLGWKRTHEESVARALDLLAAGHVRQAIADELGVSDRHLRRLLADDDRIGSIPAGRPAKPLPMRPPADTTCESGTGAQGARPRAPREHEDVLSLVPDPTQVATRVTEGGTDAPVDTRARSRAPGAGFASFADLDAWLDEGRGR